MTTANLQASIRAIEVNVGKVISQVRQCFAQVDELVHGLASNDSSCVVQQIALTFCFAPVPGLEEWPVISLDVLPGDLLQVSLGSRTCSHYLLLQPNLVVNRWPQTPMLVVGIGGMS